MKQFKLLLLGLLLSTLSFAQDFGTFRSIRLVNVLDSTTISPVECTIFYNTQTDRVMVYENGAWRRLFNFEPSISGSSFWKTTGTTNITGSTISGDNLVIATSEFNTLSSGDVTNTAYVRTSPTTVTLTTQSTDGLSTHSKVELTQSSIDITSPMEYVADYSGDYTDRTLIDRGFANTNYWKASGTTTLSGTANIALGANELNFMGDGDSGSGTINLGYSDFLGTDQPLTFLNAFAQSVSFTGGLTSAEGDSGYRGSILISDLYTETQRFTDSNTSVFLSRIGNYASTTLGELGYHTTIASNEDQTKAAQFEIGAVGQSIGSDRFGFRLSTSDVGTLNFNNLDGFVFTDSRVTKVGMQYQADYSATFTDRSLIDRGFANTNYWKTSGTTALIGDPIITTANSITISDDEASLGITLEKPTKFIGLQSFGTYNSEVYVQGEEPLNPADGNIHLVTNGPNGIKISGPNIESSIAITGRAIFSGSADYAPINIGGKNGSPTNTSTGDMWRDITTETLKFQFTGVTKTLITGLNGSAPLDFPSTPAQSESELTLTVTGASTGDAVAIGHNITPLPSGCMFSAQVTSANTVTIRFNNYSASAKDPVSGTFTATVFKP